jgi:hypothetical protein
VLNEHEGYTVDRCEALTRLCDSSRVLGHGISYELCKQPKSESWIAFAKRPASRVDSGLKVFPISPCPLVPIETEQRRDGPGCVKTGPAAPKLSTKGSTTHHDRGQRDRMP